MTPDMTPETPKMHWQRDMTEQEIDELIRGYSDEKLRDLHGSAAQHPGTVWHSLLSSEMSRRGLGASHS